MSNHTLLRLANASANYDAYERQKQADQVAALKAQDAARSSERDRWKFDQEKKAQDAQQEADALLANDDIGLASAQPMAPQQSNSVAPALADAQPMPFAQTAIQQAQTQPSNVPIYPGMHEGVPAAPTNANIPSASKLSQAKLDAFKQSNPHKTDVIAAAQAKIDALKQVESSREHQDFVNHAHNALSAFAASGGMNTDVLTNLATKYHPDGHDYKLGRNDQDGSYTLLQVDSGRAMKFDNYDKVGEYFSQMMHPDTYIDAVQKGKAKGLEKNAELPSAIAIEDAKTNGDIRKADATGVTAKNQAEVGKTKAEAANVGKHSEGKYKIEQNEIQAAFGDPAVDEKGKPIADMMTGRQIVNRNIAAEDKFYQWMHDNGITDSNEGLAKYKAMPKSKPMPAAQAEQNKPHKKPLSSY